MTMNFDGELGISTIEQITRRPETNTGSGAFERLRSFGATCLGFSCGIWLIILLIAIITVIPLTQLLVGSLLKDKCPVNYLIPIYLIVAGVMGFVQLIINICQTIEDIRPLCIILNVICGIFQFAWFIAGNVWVFGAKAIVQFNNPSDTNTYCHSTVFNCAFVIIILTYIGICCSLLCGSAQRAS